MVDGGGGGRMHVFGLVDECESASASVDSYNNTRRGRTLLPVATSVAVLVEGEQSGGGGRGGGGGGGAQLPQQGSRRGARAARGGAGGAAIPTALPEVEILGMAEEEEEEDHV